MELKGNEAWEHETGLNFDTTPIFTSDEKGAPSKQIDVEALDATPRAFWRFYEKQLWGVLVICCIYILLGIL